MDEARKKTDKKLKSIERDISRVYKMHPALIAVKKEYADYMAMVDERTAGFYRAFMDEKNIEHREELKRVYMGELEALTLKSKEYQKLIDKFTSVMAKVNQDALDIVNAEMIPIYTVNYNQVATECRKVGIKVNGEKES